METKKIFNTLSVITSINISFIILCILFAVHTINRTVPDWVLVLLAITIGVLVPISLWLRLRLIKQIGN